MPTITFSQLTDPATIFDRAHLMPRPVRRRPKRGQPNLVLAHCDGLASIHPDLPPTPAWTYEHLLPGPVIEVDADTAVEVRYRHQITTTLPYQMVVVDPGVGGSMNAPGSAGAVTTGPDAEASMGAAALHAHTVVHLHGAPTQPDADGWPENVMGQGEERDVDYQFPRETWTATNGLGVVTTFRSGAAPMFWYHDHGMGVTRLNVYAGLAGAWLVRDPIERVIGLPTKRGEEIPLVLMDRNLETVDGEPDSALTGRMLHKVQTDVRECFAPVNLVNGLAWPRCEVRPRVNRLRLVNGCNARTYRLHFLAMTSADDTAPVPVPEAMIQQIGTDSGLLGRAVPLPADGLVLSPGERADVLVDFGELALAGYHHVAVFNNAPAPFKGVAPQSGQDDVCTGDEGTFRTVPHVMRLDLRPGRAITGLNGNPIAGMSLDPAYVRLEHGQLGHHSHAIVALREEDEVVYDDTGNPIDNRTMLYLHELMPQDQADRLGVNLHRATVPTYDPISGTVGARPAGVKITLPADPTPWVSIGRRFNDASQLTLSQGSWHIWRVINLSPDTHPFHVHLVNMQAISRVQLAVDTAQLPTGVPKDADEYVFVASTSDVLEENEKGWKDTIRVNPGMRDDATDAVITAEMLSVGACFDLHSGRYVYHCHILEHEDAEMMRSFTVLPSEVMAVMGHQHMH